MQSRAIARKTPRFSSGIASRIARWVLGPIVAGLLLGFFGQATLGTAASCSTSTSQPRNAWKPATTFQAVFPVTFLSRSHLRYSRLARGPTAWTLRLRQNSK